VHENIRLGRGEEVEGEESGWTGYLSNFFGFSICHRILKANVLNFSPKLVASS
jgi:hypothetical protein